MGNSAKKPYHTLLPKTEHEGIFGVVRPPAILSQQSALDTPYDVVYVCWHIRYKLQELIDFGFQPPPDFAYPPHRGALSIIFELRVPTRRSDDIWSHKEHLQQNSHRSGGDSPDGGEFKFDAKPGAAAAAGPYKGALLALVPRVCLTSSSKSFPDTAPLEITPELRGDLPHENLSLAAARTHAPEFLRQLWVDEFDNSVQNLFFFQPHSHRVKTLLRGASQLQLLAAHEHVCWFVARDWRRKKMPGGSSDDLRSERMAVAEARAHVFVVDRLTGTVNGDVGFEILAVLRAAVGNEHGRRGDVHDLRASSDSRTHGKAKMLLRQLLPLPAPVCDVVASYFTAAPVSLMAWLVQYNHSKEIALFDPFISNSLLAQQDPPPPPPGGKPTPTRPGLLPVAVREALRCTNLPWSVALVTKNVFTPTFLPGIPSMVAFVPDQAATLVKLTPEELARAQLNKHHHRSLQVSLVVWNIAKNQAATVSVEFTAPRRALPCLKHGDATTVGAETHGPINRTMRCISAWFTPDGSKLVVLHEHEDSLSHEEPHLRRAFATVELAPLGLAPAPAPSAASSASAATPSSAATEAKAERRPDFLEVSRGSVGSGPASDEPSPRASPSSGSGPLSPMSEQLASPLSGHGGSGGGGSGSSTFGMQPDDVTLTISHDGQMRRDAAAADAEQERKQQPGASASAASSAGAGDEKKAVAALLAVRDSRALEEVVEAARSSYEKHRELDQRLRLAGLMDVEPEEHEILMQPLGVVEENKLQQAIWPRNRVDLSWQVARRRIEESRRVRLTQLLERHGLSFCRVQRNELAVHGWVLVSCDPVSRLPAWASDAACPFPMTPLPMEVPGASSLSSSSSSTSSSKLVRGRSQSSSMATSGGRPASASAADSKSSSATGADAGAGAGGSGGGAGSGGGGHDRSRSVSTSTRRLLPKHLFVVDVKRDMVWPVWNPYGVSVTHSNDTLCLHSATALA